MSSFFSYIAQGTAITVGVTLVSLPFGLVLGAGYMFLYGLMPTGALMLTVGVVHAISDGFTVSSNAVAVGMVAPPDRQAAAQGDSEIS